MHLPTLERSPRAARTVTPDSGMGFRRRELLLGSAAGAALVACAPQPQPVAATAASQAVRKWKMVTSWPPGFPGLGAGAQRLAGMIGAATGGRIEVEVFAGNELVAPFEVFDAVAAGTAQMGH